MNSINNNINSKDELNALEKEKEKKENENNELFCININIK